LSGIAGGRLVLPPRGGAFVFEEMSDAGAARSLLRNGIDVERDRPTFLTRGINVAPFGHETRPRFKFLAVGVNLVNV
jgi:hypothetical protein